MDGGNAGGGAAGAAVAAALVAPAVVVADVAAVAAAHGGACDTQTAASLKVSRADEPSAAPIVWTCTLDGGSRTSRWAPAAPDGRGLQASGTVTGSSSRPNAGRTDEDDGDADAGHRRRKLTISTSSAAPDRRPACRRSPGCFRALGSTRAPVLARGSGLFSSGTALVELLVRVPCRVDREAAKARKPGPVFQSRPSFYSPTLFTVNGSSATVSWSPDHPTRFQFRQRASTNARSRNRGCGTSSVPVWMMRSP